MLHMSTLNHCPLLQVLQSDLRSEHRMAPDQEFLLCVIAVPTITQAHFCQHFGLQPHLQRYTVLVMLHWQTGRQCSQASVDFHPCSFCLKMCFLLAGASHVGPFEHTYWSVKQQLHNKQSWRPLTQHEVSHVMFPWTDKRDRPQGPHGRISFDYKNKLKNQSEVGHAIR